jgi:hypothetical protein
VVAEYELWTGPCPAVRLAFLGLGDLVGAIANEQGTDVGLHLVCSRVGAEVVGQPGQVVARAGDEAVQRHGGMPEDLSKWTPSRIKVGVVH